MAAWPLLAGAQQPDRVRRVGVLMNAEATETEIQSYLAAFTQGLRQLGWAEGQNLRIDVRWNAANAELARSYVAQLIGLVPDAILAAGTTDLTMIRQATSTVPVVFVQVYDPVAQGFVASMRQPGGNLTGFSYLEFSIGSKWLDLLKQVAPALARVAVLFNPDTAPYSKYFMPVIEAAAPSFGVQAGAALVHSRADIEPALGSFARQPDGGLIMLGDSFTRLHGKLIADLAFRFRLPAIGSYNFAEDGGLMVYDSNTDVRAQYRLAATYIDRILRGAKPGDLPVQAPTHYRFVVNLKTAKALGLTVPLPLLGLADEVIE
jgi:putative tryptophan/tyrosine transport system substrate-binding protein